MALIVLGSIVVLCLWVWLNYYIARQFEGVAKAKGHIGAQYFHLCFWLGMVGYLLVIALPDRQGSQENRPQFDADELPDL